MPKYLCLRDCFAWDRFHYEGRTYELTDVAKSPRNFRLVDEIPLKVVPTSSATIVTAPPRLETVVATPAKEYKCSVCGKVVRTAFGLSGHSRSHKKEVTNGSPNT